jgi:uncharacterized membrane protein
MFLIPTLLLMIPILSQIDFSSEIPQFTTEIPSYFIPLMLLMIIAMTVISVCIIFTPLFIVIGKFPVFEAIESSVKLAFKNFWSIFGFILLLGLINILGILCIGLGLLVTVPTSIISIYFAFYDVLELGNEGDDENSISKHFVG